MQSIASQRAAATLSAILLSAAALTATPGRAADSVAAALDGAAERGFWQDFDLVIGGAGGIAPEYEGADSYEAVGAPVIELSWRDRIFVGLDGIRALNPLTENIRIGPLLSYDGGRDEDDNDDLDGLGDVDGSITLGVVAEIAFGPYQFGARVEKAIDGHTGWSAGLSVGRSFQLSERLNLNLALETSLVDEDYMNAFFGITALQSERSGLSRFDADAGFKDVGVSLRLNYALNEHWLLFTGAGYARLVGDAADSPLVEDRGSADQFSAMIGGAYRF